MNTPTATFAAIAPSTDLCGVEVLAS